MDIYSLFHFEDLHAQDGWPSLKLSTSYMYIARCHIRRQIIVDLANQLGLKLNESIKTRI